ncbi:heptaprenylglyceryl phosphate synthase [Bacillus kwashiorkori]|uniref:heptaprenylglyceryl phosphate synthase n=1 Tax=Bacillus kwashiorkori TaxID=1522318 RepID=UPI0007824951|nr:heptaprenylglyceryl phosphate synthase [Bacillus kwashiorkori]
MYNVQEWKHVFKLDPNKEISDEHLEKICESGTDAIIIGGTDGVTLENVLNLMARVRRYPLPCSLEVSSFEAITPGFDLYFIPTVLNSKNREWIVGQHHQVLKEVGYLINWDEVVVEGYCVLNPNSHVAKLTEADTNLDEDDIISYAQLCERIFQLPIFYLEYSGTYGNPEIVKGVKDKLENAQLFYGGGITDATKAEEMSKHADTIVVGNIIYEDLERALTTVKAVKKMSKGID